jgi:hypothetical protein
MINAMLVSPLNELDPQELDPQELDPQELDPQELDPQELEPQELEPQETDNSSEEHVGQFDEISSIVYAKTTQLLDKYKDDTFVMSKISRFFATQLVSRFDKVKRTRQQHLVQSWEQDELRDKFIYSFLHEGVNRFYYISASEIFVRYGPDNITNSVNPLFTLESPDTIHNLIESEIYNCMDNIPDSGIIRHTMQQIKQQNLTTILPCVTTIDAIMNTIVPSCFPTTIDAKFVLTIIGDHLLCKPTNNVYYVNAIDKHVINWLSDNASKCWFASGFTNSFRTRELPNKTSDKQMSHYLVKLSLLPTFQTMTSNQLFNMFCLAHYFSVRYGNATSFIQSQTPKNPSVKYILTLFNTSAEQMYARFTATNAMQIDSSMDDVNYGSISHTRNTHARTRKNLWKQFLESQQIPNFVYNSEIRHIIGE